MVSDLQLLLPAMFLISGLGGNKYRNLAHVIGLIYSYVLEVTLNAELAQITV